MFTFICRTPLLRDTSGEKYGKTDAQKGALKSILLKVLTSDFPKIWRDIFWEAKWNDVRLGDSRVFVDDSLTPMFFLEVHGLTDPSSKLEETFAALFQQAMIQFFKEATDAYKLKFTLFADNLPYYSFEADILKEYLPFSMFPEEEMPPDGYCWWVIK